ncbi:MAG TPA: GGDEF domain-containing protein [Caulobacter sp.]|nr:GGDEF domain-containing protein [Caulobacter sp.]
MKTVKNWIASSRRLPDDVLGELIDQMFGSLDSALFTGAAFLVIGALVADRLADPYGLALAIGGFVLILVLAGVMIAYRKRTARRALSRQEAKAWERSYGWGACGFSLFLTLYYVRALASGDAVSHMLLTTLVMGYGAGLVATACVRPLIASAALSVLVLPAVAALSARALAEDGQDAMAYGAQATLLGAMLLSGLRLVHQGYQATVTQLQAKRNFAKMAREDALTGLPNRLLLRERFDADVARADRTMEWVALHFLDLDRFKAVNDQHGHPIGDQLLCLVAARLKATLRGGDTAARLGGDEFVVVQTGVRRREEADELAKRIVTALSAPYHVDGVELNIGTSIGIALAPQDGLDLEQLALRADAALYRAKNRRRGSIAFWADADGDPPDQASPVVEQIYA